MNRKYSSEQLAFIRDNVKGRSFVELTQLFNARFGTDYPQSQVMSVAYRHGYKNGKDPRLNPGWAPTQFKKGHIPHNKGKKGICQGGVETQFKPGNMPHNHRPIGSERTSKDGYLEVKIAEPKTWRGKHILIWEQHNGPRPKGHAVIFADGDRRNLNPDNLLLVSRAELAVLNKRRLISRQSDLTEAGLNVAKLIIQTGKREKTAR